MVINLMQFSLAMDKKTTKKNNLAFYSSKYFIEFKIIIFLKFLFNDYQLHDTILSQ